MAERLSLGSHRAADGSGIWAWQWAHGPWEAVVRGPNVGPSGTEPGDQPTGHQGRGITMTRMIASLHVRAIKAVEAREAGQGTLEYVGMIAVAALLVLAVVGAFGNGSSLGAKVSDVINKITSIGP